MSDIYFIYDGECPICNYAARAFRIKQAVGNLHLIDARTEPNHPLMQEVNKRGLNIDDGMVIIYEGGYYHGRDAIHLMGLLDSDIGWFNKINSFLFKSKPVAKICYPFLRACRNTLLKIKGVRKIDNLKRGSQPIFQSIFGADWERLPPVMKKHYANHAYRDERVMTEGIMKVESSTLGRLMTPFFKLAGTLAPYEGENVPATVVFISTADSNVFQFDRTFNFPGKKPYRFHSRMKPVGGNEMVEFMRFGLGWHMAFTWTGEKVVLTHKGYVMNVFGLLLPLPLGLLMGKGSADETPINDNEFSMTMEIRHPLWGKVYGYSGRFRMAA